MFSKKINVIRDVFLLTSLYATTSSALAFTETNGNSEASSPTKSYSGFTQAIHKGYVEPDYPRTAKKYGKEGWVEFSFTIEPDGSVSNILTVDHSGSAVFISPAQEAIAQWTFEPATENGKPVQSCYHNVRMDFRLGTQGVSKKFNKFYKKASTVLASRDAEAIAEINEKINEYQPELYSEETYLDILKLDYAASIRDATLYNELLNAIRLGSAKLLIPETWTVLGRAKLDLLIEHNKIIDALILLSEIEADQHSIMGKQEIAEVRDQLIGYRDSEYHLVIPATTNIVGNWRHILARKQFLITDIDGELSAVDIRCDNKRKAYDVKENALWKIPDSWNNCQVYISGEPEATFNLVEFPDAGTESSAEQASE